MQNKQELPIRYRPAIQEDVPFIFNSWLKSFRHSNFAKAIDSTVYFDSHHKLLEHLMKTNQVIVACQADDPTQVYGYICGGYEENCLVVHYIYVKHPFRCLGIGKGLLNTFNHDSSVAAVYTHHTKPCDRLAPRFNFFYHPYLLINQEVYKDDSEAEASA